MQAIVLEGKTASALARTDLQTSKLIESHRHLGMLRLNYLRKMLMYALLCLLAKAVAANPCFGFAMQYCQLRMPNAFVVFAKAFRWNQSSEALFFSFI
ncbi:hypothetical protein P3T76_002204 [Phytophthora citrophthora]|uniref:Uncharacterized protein n=1 Tax=Phytophthora citrophthora TaxID=4793 RepID=A0AAD9GXN6_9STRA|nr:hypothetical protein P3T76_002204 [Phytophthora citrophthora]